MWAGGRIEGGIEGLAEVSLIWLSAPELLCLLYLFEYALTTKTIKAYDLSVCTHQPLCVVETRDPAMHAVHMGENTQFFLKKSP